MTTPIPCPQDPSPADPPGKSERSQASDPLVAFGDYFQLLHNLLHHWHKHTGGRWKETLHWSFIDDPPVRGDHDGRGERSYQCQHHGPQFKITLVLSDPSRANEMAAAIQAGTWHGVDEEIADIAGGHP